MKRKFLTFVLVMGLCVGTTSAQFGSESSTTRRITATHCSGITSFSSNLIQLQQTTTRKS